MASRGAATVSGAAMQGYQANQKPGPDEDRRPAVTMSLHPNPATGPVRVSWQTQRGASELDDPIKLVVYDLLGVAVVQQTLTEGTGTTQSIVLPALPEGVYFCLLRSGTQTIATQRLIVKR